MKKKALAGTIEDTGERLTVAFTQEDMSGLTVDWEAVGGWSKYNRSHGERLRLLFVFKDNDFVYTSLSRRMPHDQPQLMAAEVLPWTHLVEMIRHRDMGLLLRQETYRWHYYVMLKKRARAELQVAIDTALERGWLGE